MALAPAGARLEIVLDTLDAVQGEPRVIGHFDRYSSDDTVSLDGMDVPSFREILESELPLRVTCTVTDRSVRAPPWHNDYEFLLDVLPATLPAEAVGAGARWQTTHDLQWRDGATLHSERITIAWKLTRLDGTTATLESERTEHHSSWGDHARSSSGIHTTATSVVDLATLALEGRVSFSRTSQFSSPMTNGDSQSGTQALLRLR